MQTDGNLVLYDTSGQPYWDSNTQGNPGAFLNVQDDGNLVVYRAGSTTQTETANNALWASGTFRRLISRPSSPAVQRSTSATQTCPASPRTSSPPAGDTRRRHLPVLGPPHRAGLLVQWPCLKTIAVSLRFVAHDGSEGLSPEAGCRPDSVGVLARVFTPELVDAAVDAAGAGQRRRLLPARLMVYFVLALWLFRGRNCGYGQVMTKLADGLYHQRRAGDLLAGQQLDPGGWVDAGGGRRWKPPNISSLSRGRGKLGPAPLRFLFLQVAGPTGDEGTPGVFCCGLRVVSMTGQPRTCRTARPTTSSSAARPTRPGTGRSRRSGGWRRRSPGPGACWAPRSAPTGTPSRRWPATCWRPAASGRGCSCWRTASSCPGRWPASSSPPGRTSCGAPPRPSPSSR